MQIRHRNIALLLQYKGSAYHGWQCQQNAVTVQEVLEKAVAKVCGLSGPLYGCGRTDAGVHALYYVCNFFSETKIPDDKIAFALNHVLPDDICILGACTVAESFHARFGVVKKQYRYKILNTAHGDVFQKDLAWHYKYKLDVERMRRAGALILGEHDFRAFCASGAQVKDFVRTVYSVDITQQDGVVLIDVCGNGFLYNMVRILAGTLAYVGAGRTEPEEVGTILASHDRRLAGITAPPHGLYMARVSYEDEIDWK